MDKEELMSENLELKKENKKLRRIIEEQQLKEEQIRLKQENQELKEIMENKNISYNNIKAQDSFPNYKERKHAETISLLNRSEKRIRVLESLEEESKIPSQISKDINDSSYNISKYLKKLKEFGLVICLNENDKRYRYYKITDKGKKYLDIIRNQ